MVGGFSGERSQHPGQSSTQSRAGADLVIKQIPVMQHHFGADPRQFTSWAVGKLVVESVPWRSHDTSGYEQVAPNGRDGSCAVDPDIPYDLNLRDVRSHQDSTSVFESSAPYIHRTHRR